MQDSRLCGLAYYCGPQPNTVVHAESGRIIQFATQIERDLWMASQFGRRIERMAATSRRMSLADGGRYA